MMLYKSDCNSNDCKLPNKKTTPSILAIECRDVAYEAPYVGWALIRIPYYYTTGAIVPYLLNQTLYISSPEFVQHLFETGIY